MRTFQLEQFEIQGLPHSAVIGAAVCVYLALVGFMLYAIVVLIHADEQPPPFTRPQPVVLMPPAPVAQTVACAGAFDTGAYACPRHADFHRASAAREPHVITRNLLWAPPGAVWMSGKHRAASQAPAIAPLIEATGTGDHAKAMPVMASR